MFNILTDFHFVFPGIPPKSVEVRNACGRSVLPFSQEGSQRQNAFFRHSPSREKSVWSAPQSATNAKLKMIFPLKMPRAQAEGISNHFLYKKARRALLHGGLWFTVYSALVSGFVSALASGFAAGAAAGAAGFTTGFGGLGSSFSGNRMMCLGHFWAHIPQPLHLS